VVGIAEALDDRNVRAVLFKLQEIFASERADFEELAFLRLTASAKGDVHCYHPIWW
jgi:hypothetical protein